MDFSQLISSLRYREKKVKEYELPKYSSLIPLFLLIFLSLLTTDVLEQLLSFTFCTLAWKYRH